MARGFVAEAPTKGLGQVAALGHSSLTNDQQHEDDDENHKEGVAIGHYQLHKAGLENLLPSVKKTKRLTRPEEKKHTLGSQGPEKQNSVLHPRALKKERREKKKKARPRTDISRNPLFFLGSF